ncbi:MAG: DUF1289 domain-containing protein [Pseudomonadota bacterium]
MSDEVWRRDEVASPCIKVCVLHPDSKLCLGCYRTGEEIARWSRLSTQERKALMDALPARADQLKGVRKGGRRARTA